MKYLEEFDAPEPLERGVWNVDESTYRADAALNFHRLKDFRRDPQLFREGFFDRANAALDESAAVRFGTACHIALLEGPDAFANRVAVFKPPVNPTTLEPYGATTKTFKEARREFDEANAGKLAISTLDAEAVGAIRRRVVDHPFVSGVLGGWGDAEIAVKGELDVDGVKLAVKGRLDRYGAAGLVDLKTTSSFDDGTGFDRFKRSIYSFKYLVQLGFYHLLLTEICGAPFVPVWLLAVEREAPNRVALYAPTRSVVSSARDVAVRWLREYVRAERTGYYPSRFDAVRFIEDYNPELD